jgi:CHASE2 domain-containing sensor protein
MQASLGEQTPATVFISYAHEDEAVRQELEKRLVALERKGILRRWDDRHITAGSEWAGAISEKLNSARLILLLVSPDFDASDFCNTVEVPRAIERHRAGEARVIPVLIRPTPNWKDTPSDERPVSKWGDKDDAYSIIVKEIQKALEAPPPVVPAQAFLANREIRSAEMMKGPLFAILRAAVNSLLVAGLFLIFNGMGWLERLELLTIDERFRLAPAGEKPGDVIIIAIDDESKQRLSPRQPISRAEHLGELINRLSDAGAASIGLDVMLGDVASRSEDGELVAAVRDTPAVVLSINLGFTPLSVGSSAKAPELPPGLSLPLIAREVMPTESVAPPFEAVAKVARRGGHVTLWSDVDGAVRKLPALMAYGGKTYPALSLAVAMQARGVQADGVRLIDRNTLELTAGDGSRLRVPVDDEGSMLINYRRGAAEPRVIPLWHVLKQLDATAIKSLFQGKVVLVGSTLDGDSDIGPTPLEPTSALVKVHAQATETILRNAFVFRAGNIATTIIVLGLTVLVAALAVRLGPILGLVTTCALVAAYLGVAFWLFCGQTRWVLPMVAPALAAMFTYVVETIVLSAYHRKRLQSGQ